MYLKGNHSGFFGKGGLDRLIGAGKGLARIFDEPIVQGAISAAMPSVAPLYAAAKSSGILEKLKH